MNYTIGLDSVISLGATVVLGFFIPIALYIVMTKVFRCPGKIYLEGLTISILVGLLLKQIIHGLVLETGFGQMMMNNGWLRGLYSGLVSALLEESVRIFMFKKRLADYLDHDFNAVTYGAGQGGGEMVYALVVCLFSSMQAVMLIYSGQAEVLYYGLDGEALESSLLAIERLTTVHPLTFLASVVERLSVIVVHMSASVLVWFGVKEGGKTLWKLTGLAAALHVLVEMVAPVFNQYGANLVIVEAGIVAVAVINGYVAYKVWKKYHKPAQEEEE